MAEKKKTISDEVRHVLEEMAKMKVGSAEYAAAVGNLEGLCKAKGSDATGKVSPDTLVVVAANLLGILLILNYERMNVVGTKAMSLLLRGRI